MSLNYCVFWIPTIYHTDVTILNPDPQTKDISDKMGKQHNVTVSLNQQNHNLTIKSVPAEGEEAVINLKCEDHCRNGLFSYSYEYDDNIKEQIFLQGNIPNAIYHMVKGFYHQHKYHKSTNDSVLDAFVYPEKINIKDDDNKALIFYLEQYESKFQTSIWDIEDKYRFLEEEDKTDENRLINLQKRLELDEFICNILGEAIYYRTLLESKYNKSFRYTPPQAIEGEKNPNHDLYKKALNVRNSLSHITLMQKKNFANYQRDVFKINVISHEKSQNIITKSQDILTNSQEILTKGERDSKLGLKLGRWGLITGIIGGVISIISFIIPFLSAHPETPVAPSAPIVTQQPHSPIDTSGVRNTNLKL